MSGSTAADVPLVRPGAAAWWQLVRCETRMVFRDTSGLVLPIALPLLILVMSATGAGAEPVHGRFTALDAYVLPLVIVIVLTSIGVINVPSFLAYYRYSGILRRLAVTPVSPLLVLAAQLVVGVAQAMLGIALAVLVALTAFDASPPGRPVLVAAVLLLAAVALYSTGMVVASLAPTPNAAVAIGMVGFFALGALGGMFGGVEALPAPLAVAGTWLPFGASVDALSAAWVGRPVRWEPLVALAASTVVGLTVAVRCFRWDR